jgi:hypothetical protein
VAGAAQRVADGVRDALYVVADGDGAIEVNSQAAQVSGEITGICIHDFAEEDFGADGDDFR